MDTGCIQSRLEDDDVALIERLQEQALNAQHGFRRSDLIRLMMISGLSETQAFLKLALDQSDTSFLSPDVIRSMIRLAHVDHNDPARPPRRRGRGRYKVSRKHDPLIEERLVQNDDGVLQWEVRLTTRGSEERGKLARQLFDVKCN